jgi:histidinol-phosphate aminotransferase
MKYGRALLAGVEGYVPGEQPRTDKIIKLNTNENPYPPSPRVAEALAALGEGRLRKYPDPMSVAFRRACAERHGYPSEDWVIAGNGMDEILAMAMRTFVDPGDTVVSPYPTYILYETLAKLHGAVARMIDLDDAFQLPEAFFSANARMAFVPRPNSPTGILHPRADMERLCSEFNGLVFIDEAYVDFAADSCVDFVHRHENVIIGRTFSKSFGLAGMRIGIGIARPELIREFLKTKDSYNMNVASQAAGLAAMQDYDLMLAQVARIKATRARVADALRAMGFTVPESHSNFLLARWDHAPTARQIFESLRERGIIVRYFPERRLADALRVSIGTDAEMDGVLSALRDILQ